MKNNKVCIVTGASRGLGRGIALVLAREEGCTVYATARNEEALKALAEEAAAGTKGGVVKRFARWIRVMTPRCKTLWSR